MPSVDLPRVHPRQTVRDTALHDVHSAFLRAMRDHELTAAEALHILSHILGTFSGGLLRKEGVNRLFTCPRCGHEWESDGGRKSPVCGAA